MSEGPGHERLLGNAKALQGAVSAVLYENDRQRPVFRSKGYDSLTASAVLFVLGHGPPEDGLGEEPCLILNKRSRHVRQPGDLCCPGGSVAPGTDFYLAKVLKLPFLPLRRWPHWRKWRRAKQKAGWQLPLLLATSLRESFEEMRLNPLRVRFLGPMPREGLVVFERYIYPMVAWLSGQRRFSTNWEVEKVVHIPLRALLRPENYGRYRLQSPPGTEDDSGLTGMDFPCFIHRETRGPEVLWGATYRITTVFLKMIFHFDPPPMGALPVTQGELDKNYYG